MRLVGSSVTGPRGIQTLAVSAILGLILSLGAVGAATASTGDRQAVASKKKKKCKPGFKKVKVKGKVKCKKILAPAEPTPIAAPSPPIAGGGGGSNPGPAPSSYELIDQAVVNGEIDAETALIYKLFADFSDPQLPSQYRGEDSGRIGHTLDTIAELYETLSPEAQEKVDPFFVPPAFPFSWWDQYDGGGASARAATRAAGDDDATRPKGNWTSTPPGGDFRVWWDDQANPSYATLAAEVAAALDKEIRPELGTLFGFDRPISDAGLFPPYNGGGPEYDVYLGTRPDSPTEGTDAVNIAASRGCRGVASFVVINPVAWGSHLLATVAHEYAHAFLRSYKTQQPCDEYLWLGEATSEWAADYVYPDDEVEWGSAPVFLDNPELPLETPEWVKPLHPYGAYLWPFFLSHKYGAGLIAQIWQNTEKATSLEAIQGAIDGLGTEGGGFEHIWPQFALYNWNRAPVDFYQQWDGLQTGAKLRSTDDRIMAPNETEELPQTVPHLAARYFRYQFTDDVKQIETRQYLNGVQGARIQALVKIGGAWQQPEDWTDTEVHDFCREKPDENLTELVLIISNSVHSDPGYVLPAEPAPTVNTRPVCAPADLRLTMSGTVEDLPGGDGLYEPLSYSWSADVELEPEWGFPNETATEEGWLYHQSGGTLTFGATGMRDDCALDVPTTTFQVPAFYGPHDSSGKTFDIEFDQWGPAPPKDTYTLSMPDNSSNGTPESPAYRVDGTVTCPDGEIYPTEFPWLSLEAAEGVPGKPGDSPLSGSKGYTTEFASYSYQWTISNIGAGDAP